jgi:hypothetical protein
MTDEIKLAKDIQRAARAKALTEDDILKGAFETLKKQYSESLLGTSVNQADDRERLYLAYRVLTEVERHLMQIVNDGKLADAELRALEKLAQPKPSWSNIR